MPRSTRERLIADDPSLGRDRLWQYPIRYTGRLLQDVAPTIIVATFVLAACWWLEFIDLLAALVGAVCVIVTALAMRAGPIAELRDVRNWLTSAADAEREPPSIEVGDTVADLVITPAMALRRGMNEQRALAQSYAELVERFNVTLPDPCFLVTPNQEVVSPNQAARRVFDIARDRIPLALVIRDPSILSGITAALVSGEQKQLTVSPANDPDRRYAATIEPLRFLDSKPGVLVMLREEHDQVIIERMRSDFIANVSHELRTPLTAFTGFVETLQGAAAEDPEARNQFLALMKGEAWRMTRLVNDLLSLSKLETSASSPPTTPCDIGDELARVADTMAPLAQSADTAINIESPVEALLVRGDSDQLHQLFGNLIENAIKYGGDGGKVGVWLLAHEKAPPQAGPLAGSSVVEVSIKDDGPGIERHHIPRLTERFYRADKARSRSVGGTGLGLAIVKHILRRHSGHLAVASTVGEGSTFSVFLPLMDETN